MRLQAALEKLVGYSAEGLWVGAPVASAGLQWGEHWYGEVEEAVVTAWKRDDNA